LSKVATEGEIERETMEFDVVIVGAGPAGLAAAISLKQLAAEKDKELSVVVLEKGSEVGAHILSGAVIDPVGLDRLIPDWREKGSPLTTKMREDRFYYLWKTGGFRVPNIFMPPLMSNHGCYIGSLGSLCRWLAEQAEALGVEVYPGFSVVDVIFGSGGVIEGVITGDMGVARDGSHKDNYTPGIAITGKYTLFAEGARGSLSKMLIRKLDLDQESGPQKFGIGLKELWEVPAEKHKPGPRPAHHGLAARGQDRRRLVPLPFRRAAGVGRLRRPSRLRQSLSQSVQRVSARQDAPPYPRALGRRQTH
jgi:electron-transferring-flavoprotein dehydrogenase